MSDDWSAIEALPQVPLATLFAQDTARVERFGIDVAGIRFDWSKTHLSADAVAAFAAIARARDLAGRREALFAGRPIGEGEAAGHTAERGEGADEGVARAAALHARMRALIDAIEAELLGPVRHVVHLAGGAAAIGPELLVDALGRDGCRYDVATISTVDGVALEEAFARFDPAATLLVIASHGFDAPETMLNAQSALAWMGEAGVDDPYGRVVAVTAAPDRAVEWGVDETRVLPFAASVGERFSLWSAAGFTAALALGWDRFEELLDGAAEMDRHFRLTALGENAPALAAFADLYYTQARGAATRAVLPHDERLRLLLPYLQMLEMGSGAGARAGTAIPWGGVGTGAYPAVLPMLHAGAIVPVEFLGVVEPGDTIDEEHHRRLLLSAFAQGAALMTGDARHPGDRPSATILLDDLDARTLGALLAFYEHRVFVNAVLLGIDPFAADELPGEAATLRLLSEDGEFDPSTIDLVRRATL